MWDMKAVNCSSKYAKTTRKQGEGGSWFFESTNWSSCTSIVEMSDKSSPLMVSIAQTVCQENSTVLNKKYNYVPNMGGLSHTKIQ